MIVKFNVSMAGPNISYSTGEIIELEDGLANRLIDNGTVTEVLDNEEVLQLKEKIRNLQRELSKKKKK